MHLVIKSEDRPSGDQGDTIFGKDSARSKTTVKRNNRTFDLLYGYVCPRSQSSTGTSQRHLNNNLFSNCYGKLIYESIHLDSSAMGGAFFAQSIY